MVGLGDINKSSGLGSCHALFRPSPDDAVLYLNEDSIGIPKEPLQLIAGTYEWSFRHDLCHVTNGTLHLEKGTTDTIDVALCPAHGYIRIVDDYGFEDDVTVYLNGKQAGEIPFQSGKLAPAVYEVMLEKDATPVVTGRIEVKEGFTSIEGVNGLFATYYYGHKQTDTVSETPTDTIVPVSPHTRFQPIIGKAIINSDPEASLIIDSVDYGSTPVTVEDLQVGRHTLTLSKRGYEPATKEFIVSEGQDDLVEIHLQQRCIVNITSDTLGDAIYVNKKLVGQTPCTIELPFGEHSFTFIRIKRRAERRVDKDIVLTPDEPEKDIVYSMGQFITVEAASSRNRVYVDGKYHGKTPANFYLRDGEYTLTAERGWKSGSLDIAVGEDLPKEHFVETHYLTPRQYLQRGAFFFTGDIALMSSSKPTYGFTIGDICDLGNAGWFLTVMANTNFDLFNVPTHTDESGFVNGNMPNYTGEQSTLRASANIGALLRIAGPVFMKIGAGAGVRNYAWKTYDEATPWVVVDPNSWKNAEVTLGFQCCIYNFVLHADALMPIDVLTQKKNLFEFRAGFGFCFKHKHKH